MRIIVGYTLAIIVLTLAVYMYRFAMKDAMNMYPRSKKPVDDELRENNPP
jgi:hypothetical protein